MSSRTPPEPDDLYFVQCRVTGSVKVGRSRNVQARIAQLQTGCPQPLRVILLGVGMGHRERGIHRLLRRYRTSGEWFTEDSLGHVPDDVWANCLPWYLEDPDWWKK